jgi:hypothetical protein
MMVAGWRVTTCNSAGSLLRHLRRGRRQDLLENLQ